MILVYLRRGLAAGLLAGLLAGLVGLVAVEPSLEAAIALEEARANPGGAAHHHAHEHGVHDPGAEIGRPVQKAGLVAGSGLAGMAVGALFGVAAAWAVGRLDGGGWTRSLKLGAALVGAVVVLPAVKYPPNPPGAVDPQTIGLRTGLYLGLVISGVLLAGASWTAARQLAATSLSEPTRRVVVVAGTLAAAILLLWALPDLDERTTVPRDLLWSFRLRSLLVQMALYGGTAAFFSLLSARAEWQAGVPLRPARSGGKAQR